MRIDQGTVTLAANAPVGALQNLADNKAPGAAGFVRANVDLNIGDLAKQLPALFAVKEGLTITGGKLKQVTDITLAPTGHRENADAGLDRCRRHRRRPQQRGR